MLLINKLIIGGGTYFQDRIEWIDYLKAISIFGALLYHTPGCMWITPPHVNTVFFFLAGIFFKPRPFSEFLKRHIHGLLVPFIFFYVLSYPLNLIRELCEGRSLSELNWDFILNVLAVRPEANYIYANGPLWFLLCLFWVQLFYYGVNKLPSWGRVAVLTAIWLLWDVIAQIPSPFMWNNAMCYMLYFGVGSLAGKRLIALFENKTILLPVLASGAMLIYFTDNLLMTSYTARVYYLMWCVFMLGVAFSLRNVRGLEWMGFIGRNTIVIIGLHMFVVQTLFSIQSANNIPVSIWSALTISAITILIMVPLIRLFNSYLPVASAILSSRRGTEGSQRGNEITREQ